MTLEELEQLKAMSYDERVAKYKPLREEKRINFKEYVWIICNVPYSSIEKEDAVLGADMRESMEGNEGEDNTTGLSLRDLDEEGCGKTDELITQDAFIASLERTNPLPLSRNSDGKQVEYTGVDYSDGKGEGCLPFVMDRRKYNDATSYNSVDIHALQGTESKIKEVARLIAAG
jgi:hypothetical protein